MRTVKVPFTRHGHTAVVFVTLNSNQKLESVVLREGSLADVSYLFSPEEKLALEEKAVATQQ